MNAVPGFALFFALWLGAVLLLQLTLALRQMRCVAAHSGDVPAAFAASVTLPEHQKSARYTIAKERLAVLEAGWDAASLALWTLGGALGFLDGVLRGWLGAGMAQQLALIAAFAVIQTLLGLPFALWRIFVLEARFGFNRMTPKLFVRDLLLSTLLAALIGLPLAAALLTLMAGAGALWWLYAWALFMAVQIAALLLFPRFIAPLFNRFTPLQDTALQEGIAALLARSGLAVSRVFVMDGSRRSAHANAYFTGFGRARRIVLFDTLIAQLSREELLAVLAHELGHWRHGDVWRRLVFAALFSLAALAALGALGQQSWFFAALGGGAAAGSAAMMLLLFLLTLPVFLLPFSPVFNTLSRRQEFAADAFAARQCGAAALASALVKLYRDNAATLTPDPWYSRFHDSHPSAPQRLAQISPNPLFGKRGLTQGHDLGTESPLAKGGAPTARGFAVIAFLLIAGVAWAGVATLSSLGSRPPFASQRAMIEYRQSVFTLMAATTEYLSAMLNGGQPTRGRRALGEVHRNGAIFGGLGGGYDAQLARDQTTLLVGLAALPWAAFPPGSMYGTAAKDTIWKQPERFAAMALQLRQEVLLFSAAQREDDIAAMRESIERIALACKDCHDTFVARKN